jgi:hypothetical protein
MLTFNIVYWLGDRGADRYPLPMAKSLAWSGEESSASLTDRKGDPFIAF